MKFDQVYSRDEFLKFLEDFLPEDFAEREEDIVISKDRCKKIHKAQVLGESDSLGLSVLEVEHESENDPRVSIATDAFKILADHWIHKALVIFKSTNSENYRLSLLTISLDLNEKNKTVRKYSNARRYSFYLGPGAKINTPTKYLLKSGRITDFDDLKDRFSLEVVNKDFYKEISHLFAKLVGGSYGNGKNKKEYESLLELPSVTPKSQTSLEFGVRLIGRVIFCWFLREKKSEAGTSLMPSELLSHSATKERKDYYHTILEPIFFEILNKPVNSRKDQFVDELFSLIPYLNGGLFSPQNDDYFSYNEGKQAIYHNTVKVPDEWIQEFFEFLETYNFTIDENISFDEELSIDPEMLGRIFENLLAEINPETGESARKSTGSYYTPRTIVDYMVDESIFAYLQNKTGVEEEKLRAVISYDLLDDQKYPLNDQEKEKVVSALSEVKILDPACGSGAFPIGALQKIVFILQQVDPNGQEWFKQQIKNTSPEIRRVIEREFQDKNFDYIRKLGVIRENIFGVDIQPIATEISRLRCFLTLVVDESVRDGEDNRGIEPLPNLDFKFVTANSLIGLPTDPTGELNSQGGLFEDRSGIEELQELRNMFFTASGTEREQIKLQFVQAQNRIFQRLIQSGSTRVAELTTRLTSWDPFSHQASNWFDPEWMFGIKNGFDIVIANPPYIDSESMVKNIPALREIYTSTFGSAKGNWDLFIIFIEKGLQLLDETGNLTFIVPNKLIAAKYSESVRKLIQTKNIRFIRDYSDVNVFKEASVYPVVFQVSNKHTDKSNVQLSKMESLESKSLSNNVPHEIFYEDIYWDRYFIRPEELEIIIKLTKNSPLSKFNEQVLGAATVNEAYKLKEIIEEVKNISEVQYKKLINSGTIDPYTSLWNQKKTQYIKKSYDSPVVKNTDLKELLPNRYAQAESKKLIIAGMSKRLEVFYDSGEYIAGKSTTIILVNDKINPFYLTAILNSKLISYWYRNYFSSLSLAGGYLRIGNNEIKKIPIAFTNKAMEEKLIKLAEQLCQLRNESPTADVSKLESDIDQIVYGIYQLTPEEIKIVEENGK